MIYFILIQYILVVFLAIFFLYSFRLKSQSLLAWMMRLLVVGVGIKYITMFVFHVQEYYFNLVPDTHIDNYLRNLPTMIIYLIFFIVYLSQHYREDGATIDIGDNTKSPKEIEKQ